MATRPRSGAEVERRLGQDQASARALAAAWIAEHGPPTSAHAERFRELFDGRVRYGPLQGVRVRLGSRWSIVARSPRQVAAIPWHALATSGSASAWYLRFVTPTTFRRGNAFTPNPSLRAIVGSLRNSWQRCAPPSVGPVDLDLALEPLWLTDIDVASHVVRVDRRTVSGFTGRLRFACDGGDEVASAVDRLVRLAPYAGVGAHTTRGFGVTRPEPTWPAPRPLGEPA